MLKVIYNNIICRLKNDLLNVRLNLNQPFQQAIYMLNLGPNSLQKSSAEETSLQLFDTVNFVSH